MNVKAMVSVVCVASLLGATFAYRMALIKVRWIKPSLTGWLAWSIWAILWIADGMFVLFFSAYSCQKIFITGLSQLADRKRCVAWFLGQCIYFTIPSAVAAGIAVTRAQRSGK